MTLRKPFHCIRGVTLHGSTRAAAGLLLALGFQPGSVMAASLASWPGGELVDSGYRACLAVTGRRDAEEAVYACALDRWLASQDEEACETAPATAGATLQKRAGLLLPVVRRELRDTIEVSKEDVDAALARHKAARAEQPAERRLRHIFINAAPDEHEAAIARLSRVREDVLAGGDFARYARQQSESVNRFNGGRLGRLQVDRLPAALATVVSQLEAGNVSEPVVHGQGVYLFLNEDTPPANQVELTAEHVRELLLRRRVNAALMEILGPASGDEASRAAGPGGGSGGYRAQTAVHAGQGTQGEAWRDSALALLEYAREQNLAADDDLAAALEWAAVSACAEQRFGHRMAELVGAPPQDALRELFDEHPERFLKPERYRVSAIQFIADADAVTSEDYQQYLAVEQKIRDSDIDFAEAARKHSLHASAAEGGELGAMTLAELASRGFAVSRAMRAMQPGELTGLVNLSSGLWLYRLDERQAMRLLSFEEAQEPLEQQWRRQQRQAVQQELRTTLLEEAGITLSP